MQKLSATEKWSYSVGSIPFAVKDAAFVNFVIFFYTQIHGLSGTLAGLAMFIALLWDAISDPVVGSWCDRLRSRWGRRHPLLIAGGLPTALMFLVLFSPPADLGQLATFTWLLGVSILLRTFITIYFVPYTAMGAELSTDYDERTVIAKARVSVGWVAAMAVPAIGFIVFFGPTNGADGRLVAENYQQYGLLSALVAGIAALVCIVGTRSAIPRLPQTTTKTRFTWRDPLNDLKLLLNNRNFRVVMGANLAVGLSAGVYFTLAIYLGTYFWEFTAKQLAGIIFPSVIAVAVAFTVLGHLGKRFDKPQLLVVLSFALAINGLWFLGGRLLGLLPENGNSLVYALYLINSGIAIFMIVCKQILGASLLADIVDEQELKTGKRQEAAVFAAGAFVQKATTGAGGLIAGIVIDFSGITSDSVPGSVSQSTLQALGATACSVIVILGFISCFFYTQLRLSRTDHANVRVRLDAINS
jgi:Na+/melibiose symporter-like transporter